MDAHNNSNKLFHTLQLLMSWVCAGQVSSIHSSLSCGSLKRLNYDNIGQSQIMGERPCSQHFGHLCCLDRCIVAARSLRVLLMHANKRFAACPVDCAAISCMVQCWSACTLTAQPAVAIFVLPSLECPSSEVQMLNLLQCSPSYAAMPFSETLL